MGINNPDSTREQGRQRYPESSQVVSGRKDEVANAVRVVMGSIWNSNQHVFQVVKAEREADLKMQSVSATELGQMAQTEADRVLSGLPLKAAGSVIMDAAVDSSAVIDIHEEEQLDPEYSEKVLAAGPDDAADAPAYPMFPSQEDQADAV